MPIALKPMKSGGGPPQSKTLARYLRPAWMRSVLECASPLALSVRVRKQLKME
jgi:hypothetical protein